RLIPRAMTGMWLAHLGIAVFIFGVTMVRTGEVERDVRLGIGESTEVDGMRFTFRGAREVPGPNYRAVQGQIDVLENGRPVATLRPEKRMYPATQTTLTEAAIDIGFTRDLYVSLGEPAGGGAWIVRVYVKPFIDWIWGGCLLMAIGGFVAATDRRYRSRARQTNAAVATGAAPA
ncbi:MAG TPA: cytochrome c-type biogenesis CcmF C-terminal domain-containing protein, partial [Geminicoccaceae bacterium]